MIIAVDFDGTCTNHDYPAVGQEIGAALVLKRLTDAGHQLILFTMRCGEHLAEAQAWFEAHGIPLWGIQSNPDQHAWTSSPKCYAQLYIDDAALGCPLFYLSDFANGGPAHLPIPNRPYVNWIEVEKMLIAKGLLK